MTRLITEWIEDIGNNARAREAILKGKTGLNFVTLAAKAGGWSAMDIERAAEQIKIGVVPITAGKGVIRSFAEAVSAVTFAMGFESFVTECSDVSGIHEAHKRGADILFMADDDRYVSLNLNKRKLADNNYATAAGYIIALEEAQGSLIGKDVLLLGFGVVGQEFLKRLIKKGIHTTVFDLDKTRLKAAEWDGASIIGNMEELRKFKVVIDATNQGNWIHQGMLHEEAWIASPGIPISLDEEAHLFYERQLIYDYLEIGTAAMLGLTI